VTAHPSAEQWAAVAAVVGERITRADRRALADAYGNLARGIAQLATVPVSPADRAEAAEPEFEVGWTA
jgi:hypothetical protein